MHVFVYSFKKTQLYWFEKIKFYWKEEINRVKISQAISISFWNSKNSICYKQEKYKKKNYILKQGMVSDLLANILNLSKRVTQIA